MSRRGTLQDALRVVDEFQRAALPSAARVKEKSLSSAAAAAARGGPEDVIKQGGGRGEREGRENSEKHARRKSKREKDNRYSSRRRGRRRDSVKGEKYDDGDEDDDDEEEEEESDESDDDDEGRNDERRQRAKKKKHSERKKGRSEHRKRKERKSSFRSGRWEIREKENARKREERKREHQHWSRRLRSAEDNSSASEDKNSDSGSESSESQGRDSSLRSAEQIAAGIVEVFPEVESDFQQLLHTLDSGQAVDISGLPNRQLVALLKNLFQSLNLKKSAAGLYLLPSGSQPILERLSWCSISRNKPTPEKSEKAAGFDSERPISVGRDDSNCNDKSHSKMEATTAPLPGPHEFSDTQKRRVIGPAMPSAEMLEAAAKLTEAEEALRDAEAALENDPMIGPPPPAAVAEAASANDAERFEEVTRITASDVGDAYDLLGLKQGVSAGDLKKRYWKLSLLVHPDKCQHPLAHQAFMALNKAFKDLQDPLKRSEIDRKADEKLAKEQYQAERRAQHRAAQWRKLRGEEPLPGDAELLQGDVKDPGRDEWMTKLPPERQAGGPPSQQSTFFSRTEKSGRGDTSAWTDTPLEKAQKAKMQYLEAYKQAVLTGPENTESIFEKEKAVKSAAFLDEYNQKKRSLSLLEEHQQKSKKGLKKAKRERSQPEEEKKKEWAEAHPWKPWDREKDLTAGRQTIKWDDKKNVGESLSSRFGSSGRNFLRSKFVYRAEVRSQKLEGLKLFVPGSP